MHCIDAAYFDTSYVAWSVYPFVLVRGSAVQIILSSKHAVFKVSYVEQVELQTLAAD